MRKKKIPCLFCIVLFHFLFLAGQPSDLPQSGTDKETQLGTVPFNDISFEYCLESLNKQTPLELIYNEEVKRYIDEFLNARQAELKASLSRAERYFPLIEEILDKYNLPLELKYMAVIESGLNPLARSKSGASGLWQFLYNTCTLVDLKVNSYIDERRDPYKSTEAACRYIQYLYDTFHDWNLVLAGYNGGPGEVRKAIERSGGFTDFWEIRTYLSVQAKNYVPAFIAMNYLMNYYDSHGIEFSKVIDPYSDIDTLHIHYAISFEQISGVLNIPVSLLEELNPVYKRRYIPDMEDGCILVLPKNKIDDFIRQENRIIGFHVPQTSYKTLLASAGQTNNREKIIHVVDHGEYFHKIAINYHCTVEDIKVWNNLEDLDLIPGQALEIWIEDHDR
ncbi:MAG: transglycosylase SLT domain-containing protein [Bacteroidales bacterium]|jgi:membrane-bound lytic murein transglycosylase D